MAEFWQLAGILVGVVVIVGIITLWWRRALTERGRELARRASRP